MQPSARAEIPNRDRDACGSADCAARIPLAARRKRIAPCRTAEWPESVAAELGHRRIPLASAPRSSRQACRAPPSPPRARHRTALACGGGRRARALRATPAAAAIQSTPKMPFRGRKRWARMANASPETVRSVTAEPHSLGPDRARGLVCALRRMSAVSEPALAAASGNDRPNCWRPSIRGRVVESAPASSEREQVGQTHSKAYLVKVLRVAHGDRDVELP